MVILVSALLVISCGGQPAEAAPAIPDDTSGAMLSQLPLPTEEPTVGIAINDVQAPNTGCIPSEGARVDGYLYQDAGKSRLSLVFVDSQTCSLYQENLWVKVFVNHDMVYDNWIVRSDAHSVERLLTSFDAVSISSIEIQINGLCTIMLETEIGPITDTASVYVTTDGKSVNGSCSKQ